MTSTSFSDECDAAGYPGFVADEIEWDAQIVQMTNIWRTSRGLEPLPTPKLP